MMSFQRYTSHASLVLVSCLVLFLSTTSAFLLPANSIPMRSGVGTNARESSSLSMGIFDGISKAFTNAEYGPPPEAVKATARHILVESDGEAKVIMKMVSSGEKTFENCAREFSTCPSANQGGSLGSFSPGKMVPEFDKAIFNPDTKVGEMVGPILTNFGHHIIVVDKRTGGGDWY
jgi:peptidyl-prolyl cis-trans isomerase C